jgi:hypothetical protein
MPLKYKNITIRNIKQLKRLVTIDKLIGNYEPTLSYLAHEKITIIEIIK